MKDRLKTLVLETLGKYPEIRFDGINETQSNLEMELCLLFRNNADDLERLPALSIDGHEFLTDAAATRRAIESHVETFLGLSKT